MTKTEFLRIASRAIALYLFVCALLDCTYLPQFLYSLLHHLSQGSAFANQNYWSGYYMLETASLVLRIAVLSLGVLYFWNAGPAILRLLSPPEKSTKEQNEPAES
jgi:hypothetical protein